MPSSRTLTLIKSTSRPKLSLRGLRTSCIESEPETAAVRITRLKSSHTSRPLVTPQLLHCWVSTKSHTLGRPPRCVCDKEPDPSYPRVPTWVSPLLITPYSHSNDHWVWVFATSVTQGLSRGVLLWTLQAKRYLTWVRSVGSRRSVDSMVLWEDEALAAK